MKRAFFVALLFLGAVSGWWLARGNMALFEAIGIVERRQEEGRKRPPIDESTISLGLETWQVKDVFGPPEERVVKRAVQGAREEHWRYGDKWLRFTNGVLTSWQEGPRDIGEQEP
ncbi:MAG: hypothetical protein SWE60_06260 [Thermodesulfobacteriota bacterium]|nr:hypothetical protein [Thermodesulfobacteriota bacterium]